MRRNRATSDLKSSFEIDYPFIPKSNLQLLPGQFWAIPLSNGRFACGRVLQLPPVNYSYGKKCAFFAGVMNWISTKPPTADSIAGSKLLAQGAAHIKAIHQTGKEILGYRSLGSDKIAVRLETNAAYPPCDVVRGFKIVRPATPSDTKKLNTKSTWGFRVPLIIAERILVEGKKVAYGK